LQRSIIPLCLAFMQGFASLGRHATLDSTHPKARTCTRWTRGVLHRVHLRTPECVGVALVQQGLHWDWGRPSPCSTSVPPLPLSPKHLAVCGGGCWQAPSQLRCASDGSECPRPTHHPGDQHRLARQVASLQVAPDVWVVNQGAEALRVEASVHTQGSVAACSTGALRYYMASCFGLGGENF